SATSAEEPHDAAARAQARLAAAERRFRNLVEQIPAVTCMAVLGEGENEVYVSPHVEQLLGWSQEEWLADPFLWYWRLHPDDRQLWNDEFTRGVRTGGPFKAECRFIARDGRTVWVHGEARILKDEQGRPQYLQGIAFDITESKKAQAMLLESSVQEARHDEEKLIARRVQTSILPKRTRLPGLEIAASMEPAEEVGGDFYDVHPTFDGPGGWLVMGDVSGHGLDAGMVMMMAQSALAGLVRARPASGPGAIHSLLNSVVYENVSRRLGSDHYVTLCLLKYRPDGEVVFAGAHEHILVRRAASGAVERIETPGVWLGLRDEVTRLTVESTLTLEAGDLLVLFSDGIIEARNAKNEMYDMDRLAARLRDAPDLTPSAVRDHILVDIAAWKTRTEDDISLLVARFEPEA
ncbi:MAG: SpoIIE family protein phosphatase, partial [Sandaracinaceae bacterium]